MSARRLKVALIVDTVEFDAGTERLVRETAKRLDPAKIEAHVCCLQDSEQLQQLGSSCKTKVFPAVRLNSINGMRQVREFRRYLNEVRIDLMHAFMTRSAILGVAAFSGSPCKAMVAARLSTDWYTPFIRRFFRYYMNPRTTRIFANSEAVKRAVVEMENAPPGQIDVIYQGVDMGLYSRDHGDPAVAAALGIPGTAKVVGIVANYRPIKDLPLFLRAAKLVADRVPDAAFLLVGKGDQYSELVQLAAELGISDKVFFSNGRGKVVDYLQCMSIAALTSISEGFSNAILEYMAGNLPVVATDVGGNGEAIEHGESGFLVRNRTPEDFAAPLIQLLENDDLRRAMGKKAIERCRRLFSMEAYISHLEEYYAALAARS